MRRNRCLSTKTLMEKKRVLLVDKESDWLQILIAASSLYVKGHKAIKVFLFFLLTGQFSQIRSHMYKLEGLLNKKPN